MDAESGAQYLYAHLGMHTTLKRDAEALGHVNQNPLFWKTVDGALHLSTFIALGRLFDQSSNHNIDRVIGLAQSNLRIFAKDRLEGRKRLSSENADEWIQSFMASVYEPASQDFRKLRKFVDVYRKIYFSHYRDIRDKIHAHAEIRQQTDIDDLYSNTSADQLSTVFSAVLHLHELLWQLYHNGREPDYSFIVFSAGDTGEEATVSKTLPARIAAEAGGVLRSLA